LQLAEEGRVLVDAIKLPEPVISLLGNFEWDVTLCEDRFSFFAGAAGLAELERAITHEMREVEPAGSQIGLLSLDVFDTLLLRNNKAECERFWELSERLANSIARNKKASVGVTDIFCARLEAMELAYRASRLEQGCVEGELETIVSTQLGILGLDGHLRDKWVQEELFYECENLTANLALTELAKKFAGNGTKVILVSDMYLRRDHIKKIVDNIIGHARWIDEIYSSADVILNKRSGAIFRMLLERYKIPSYECLHIGDNLDADFIQPRTANMKAVHIPVSAVELAKRNDSLVKIYRRFLDLDINIAKWAKI
jgi:FMN phosphatase YigB (HAD superfamily)